tara:strand:- start:211 stop:543 length:333 start_codon:yes stop_codon:yes gene_type:complete
MPATVTAARVESIAAIFDSFRFQIFAKSIERRIRLSKIKLFAMAIEASKGSCPSVDSNKIPMLVTVKPTAIVQRPGICLLPVQFTHRAILKIIELRPRAIVRVRFSIMLV